MLDFVELYNFCERILNYLLAFIEDLYLFLITDISFGDYEILASPLDLMFVSFPLILTAFLLARIVF